MAHPLTLPTVGVLTLLGVGAGVHLGRAAIAEINPIYYAEAPTRFHADLASEGYSVGPGESLRNDGGSAADLSRDCVGCRTYPEEYYPIHDASLDRYQSGLAEDADRAELEPIPPESPEQAQLRGEALRRVQLYASHSSNPEERVTLASAEAPPASGQREEAVGTVAD